jgi:hypothetical protein
MLREPNTLEGRCLHDSRYQEEFRIRIRIKTQMRFLSGDINRKYLCAPTHLAVEEVPGEAPAPYEEDMGVLERTSHTLPVILAAKRGIILHRVRSRNLEVTRQ